MTIQMTAPAPQVEPAPVDTTQEVIEPAAKDQAAMLRRASGKGSADAIKMQIRAEEHRQLANRMEARGDRVGPLFERAAARDLDLEAGWILDPVLHTTGRVTVGVGGEVAIGTKAMAPFVDTVRENLSMLTVDASRRRMELADKANVLEIGLDAAATIKAANSLEKMLAHEAAAAHTAAMEFQAEGRELLRAFKKTGYVHQSLAIEASRAMNTSARMMSTYQNALLALERIRNGGKQTVVVQHQHVNVGDGGRAVVAGGHVKTGAKRRRRRVGDGGVEQK
jgi:hypothetical protein